MFTYKNIKASDMGLRVLNDVLFTSPERDTELIQVPGRDGDLVMSHDRYHSVIRSIPCRLEAHLGNVEKLINDINNWLVNSDGFHEFLWHNDPDFIYKAKIEGHIESQRMLTRFAHTVIEFRLHPIKYHRLSLREREIENGAVVVNALPLDAKPIIRIVGGGDVTVQLGDQQIILTALPDGCIIDSETQTITDLNQTTTLFTHMRSYPFPKLKPGNNKLTWTAEHIRVFLTPRLGALV